MQCVVQLKIFVSTYKLILKYIYKMVTILIILFNNLPFQLINNSRFIQLQSIYIAIWNPLIFVVPVCNLHTHYFKLLKLIITIPILIYIKQPKTSISLCVLSIFHTNFRKTHQWESEIKKCSWNDYSCIPIQKLSIINKLRKIMQKYFRNILWIFPL